tara:strand:- start:695 stop:883 length:189 start_codon:yes stop_codon:yes gene_type:complete
MIIKYLFLKEDVYILTTFNITLTTFNTSNLLEYESLNLIEGLRYEFFIKLRMIFGVFLVWLM